MNLRLSADRLREVLSYNPETGAFTWLVSRGRVAAGDLAGNLSVLGYFDIGVDGKLYGAHRLAWLYVHGEWPADQIDHINGARTDNRICNLRAVSHAQNNQNIRKAQANNKCGFLGVVWNEKNRKWRAKIKANGRALHLGYFDAAEEAHAAYLKAKAELHPFQTIAEAL